MVANLHLRDFLASEQPVSAANLWLRITIARKWAPWSELPADEPALLAELAVLEREGFAFLDGDAWRLKYPQPQVREAGMLFA